MKSEELKTEILQFLEKKLKPADFTKIGGSLNHLIELAKREVQNTKGEENGSGKDQGAN